jgi:hypothetical protein
MKPKKINFNQVIENVFVFVVAISMFAYGIAKPFQFVQGAHANSLIKDLSSQELMWTFYSHTKGYPILLGVVEVAGVFLLLVRKTRILGALLTSVVLVNVIIQDIFYEVNVGALRSAIFYQLLLIGILFFHKTQVINALKLLFVKQVKFFDFSKSNIITLLVSVVLAIILKLLEVFLNQRF